MWLQNSYVPFAILRTWSTCIAVAYVTAYTLACGGGGTPTYTHVLSGVCIIFHLISKMISWSLEQVRRVFRLASLLPPSSTLLEEISACNLQMGIRLLTGKLTNLWSSCLTSSPSRGTGGAYLYSVYLWCIYKINIAELNIGLTVTATHGESIVYKYTLHWLTDCFMEFYEEELKFSSIRFLNPQESSFMYNINAIKQGVNVCYADSFMTFYEQELKFSPIHFLSSFMSCTICLKAELRSSCS